MRTDEAPIVIDEVFNQPVEKVWNAITDLALMKQWYFENLPEFKPVVGFETCFEVQSGERIFPHRWTVTEVIPLKKISYRWRYDGYTGDSLLTMELFPEGESTRLVLTHQVLENFSDDIPEFKRESGVEGWNFFIRQRLKEFLEKET
ncbi:MAG: SRPBCC domain-containing protein, partial [Methanobacteriota archaeon]